jgi:ferredoxin
MDTVPIGERRSLETEVERGFSKETAQREAARCLRCDLFTIFDRSRCILCGGCVDICPKSCFRMAGLHEIQGDEKLAVLVKSYFGVSIEEAEKRNLATVIFKEEERCIQCGLCAKRCPTGAITMERFHRGSNLLRENKG